MTDTGPQPEVDRDFEFALCVEKSTGLIFECQYFEDFVLVRPASPMYYRNIQKLTLIDFTRDFDEFLGDHEQVYNFLYSGQPVDIETK